MDPRSTQRSSAEEIPFSLVRGGPFWSVRKKLGLTPEKGFGLAQRIAALIVITWVPTVLGALIEGRVFEGSNPDPLARHFGVHARLLITLPLFILAEGLWDRIFALINRQFVATGLIDTATVPDFRMVISSAERLRDSVWGSIVVLGPLVAVIVLETVGDRTPDELAWAGDAVEGGLHYSFAGWWYLYVARSIFVLFLSLWAWRLLVGWVFLFRIARLPLQLVPTHPDRSGGLGFIEYLSLAFAPLVLGISVVVAGRWGHEVLYHDVHVDSLRLPIAAFLVVVLAVFLGPFVLMSGSLRSFKRKSLLQYGVLMSNHGRLVRQKWILGNDVGDDPVLSAPEIGATADAITLYAEVQKMRALPVGMRSVVPIAAATILPMLPVLAVDIPIKDLLLKIVRALL